MSKNRNISNADRVLADKGRQAIDYCIANGINQDIISSVIIKATYNRIDYEYEVFRCGDILCRKFGEKEFKKVKIVERYNGGYIPNYKPASDSRYLYIKMDGEDIYVHRLIYACFDYEFSQNASKYEINHTVTTIGTGFRYQTPKPGVDISNNAFCYLEKILNTGNTNNGSSNSNHAKICRRYGLYEVYVSAYDISDILSSAICQGLIVLADYYNLHKLDNCKDTMKATIDNIAKKVNCEIKLEELIWDKKEVNNLVSRLSDKTDRTTVYEICNDLLSVVNNNRNKLVTYYLDKGIPFKVDFRPASMCIESLLR